MSSHVSLNMADDGPERCSSPDAGMELAAAARFLRNGGVLVFPTETFYGLGCLAANAEAVARVYQLKQRPVHKPLPLLAAQPAQVDAVAELAAMPKGLLTFWPGPLTVLLPARPCLPPALVNGQGLAAVRVTPHPLAAQLAEQAGGALTASSANLSGGAPVCSPDTLDPALLEALRRMAQGMTCPAGCAAQAAKTAVPLPLALGGPLPAGGLPSTVVEPLSGGDGGAGRLRIVRAGAVNTAALEAAGFTLE
ncbi:L-threonylcarbamoyladenylate synthase [Desulfovibrio desulfuricans]|uniref:L-threonylcarbamoyladenylate synthase n=1 Tax=Desulfovibrio desulfuricans TaxID=876 RepID=UPI001FDF6BCA|nr:L-threonylcarbamoyladenylate synthase [Desulfovibrio desulfuricans]